MKSLEKYLSPSCMLNWLGMRCLTKGRWQKASLLFKAAIVINPRYSSCHTNLGKAYLHAGCNSAAQNCFKQALAIDPYCLEAFERCDAGGNYEQQLTGASKDAYAKFSNVKDWCLGQGAAFVSLLPKRIVSVNAPLFVNEDLSEEDRGYVKAGEIDLPEVYLANLGKAIVIGQTSMVLTQQACLCDEQAEAQGKYSIRAGVNGLALDWNKCLNRANRKISGKAIHFCDDYSPNYFHWLTECLPRIWVIDQFPEYAELPLLIDKKLPPSFIESLQLVKGRHEIIRVTKHEFYEVEELIYPSVLSVIHDNYGFPKSMDDVLISPEGIKYVRNAFIKEGQMGLRKIFIARRSPGYRDLLNSEEIEQMLLDEGFEIVFPEKLSFQNQVKIFSQASMIISQTAAGLTNMIFSPTGCKVFALTTKAIHNYYAFNMLADACRIDLQYILGESITGSHKQQVHEDFIVPIYLVRNAIGK
jgi:capsular polysaccharide biosynthesis protein